MRRGRLELVFMPMLDALVLTAPCASKAYTGLHLVGRISSRHRHDLGLIT